MGSSHHRADINIGVGAKLTITITPLDNSEAPITLMHVSELWEEAETPDRYVKNTETPQ